LSSFVNRIGSIRANRPAASAAAVVVPADFIPRGCLAPMLPSTAPGRRLFIRPIFLTVAVSVAARTHRLTTNLKRDLLAST
jgi:hypothetical protein